MDRNGLDEQVHVLTFTTGNDGKPDLTRAGSP
jgi:hypothetical protein